MKIILTGATGFVGAEVLTCLIDHQRVDQVTCLSRRPLATTSPKVRTIFQEDFTTYDQARLDELADHSACIWALGGKASDLGEPEVITHAFTLTLASGMAANARDRFSFCYLSGMGADPSESARLPWERLTRHLKGRTEKDLGASTGRQSRFLRPQPSPRRHPADHGQPDPARPDGPHRHRCG